MYWFFTEWRGQAAIDAAEILVEQGKQVEIVTPLFFVGQDIDPISVAPAYEHLLEKGTVFTAQRAPYRDRRYHYYFVEYLFPATGDTRRYRHNSPLYSG